ncbi:HAD-IIA family hydrolase [Tranquillimonas alkanivorans]|uniref:HAD-superfamily class IIA hydrolase, TIGR01459 n=1 Tax=Tranquillimonas alkanivorans TaxID=441119 RepID=A0A1I5N0M5_9RHOB|nr:HAD-IIA family hydrolase [Tranquillimonas alkanivorans]SFP15344.1 HAD-superfamily class IIA hydrolase, TIGR01459 [Tranquillimonas alkanivorans]
MAQTQESVQAFKSYVAVRARLPEAAFGATYATAADLGEAAREFDVVMLDAYGVLNVGETPVPGAPERIAALRAAGKRVMVVSNSAGYPKRLMMQRYARLGFDFAPEEVVTSREALLRRLSQEGPRRWGLMLNPANGLEEFETLDARFLADDPAEYEAAEGFLLIGSDGWSDARQEMLEATLAARPRPVLVGNPDIVAPREDGLSREPGHFAHRLADRTGVVPDFFGKPFRDVFRLALDRLSPRPDPARVLMVGDTLHTDILGGRAMGFATALVTDFGSLKGADIDVAAERADIMPDFVIPRI